MTEVGDSINWSDVARSAFEKAIDKQNTRKSGTMTALERLKKSKLSFLKHVETNGYENGRKWAEKKGTYFELRELSLVDLEHYEDDNSGILRAAYNAVEPQGAVPLDDWINDVFDVVDPGDEWAYHFVKGAQDVFNDLKDQL